MTSRLVLYLACLLVGKTATMTDWRLSPSLHQEGSFISKNVGDEVTLPCVYERGQSRLYWYKQSLGQKPRLICRIYQFGSNGTFYNEFINHPRYKLEAQASGKSLTITDLEILDSATYYCAGLPELGFGFKEGTTVSVKGSDVSFQASIHQSASESVQQGGSVTLNCTVQAGSCDEEHSVYWFRNSEAPQPGFIYIRGDRRDQCERRSSNTQTCVFNLPMENLDRSHAGTYHCAVASCGHILFGNGTKLDVEEKDNYLVLLYFLIGALAFTTIFSVLSTFFMYKMKKKIKSQIPEFSAGLSSFPKDEGCRPTESLYRATVSVNLSNRSGRQRDPTWTETVYYCVKK